MRILFLSTWFPCPPDNGSKLRVYHLLRSLAQAHSVTLLSFSFATARPGNPCELYDLCADLQVVYLDPFAANRAGTIGTFLSLSPVVSRPLPSMQQETTKILTASVFDAAIASTEMMACYSLLAPAGVTKVLEEHNSLTRWMEERYVAQTEPIRKLRCWISWQKTRRYEARLFSRFDLVTMVSHQDRAACYSELPGYRGWVEVVSNGVDCVHNRPGLAWSQRDTLVFNGSLTYSANNDAMCWFLSDVYPLIKERRPQVSLTITGSTTGVDLSRLPLDESVRLTGFVQDIRFPVAEATVAIAPIRQGGGTRLKILEAMALGTPVVATTKGAEGLEVVNGRDVLLADTPQTMADAVLGLLANSDECDRLAQNARRLVEIHYDWTAIGQRFVRLVEEVVEVRNRSSMYGNMPRG